ncbi:unnamed protein product [Paramecium primaurelia]|uniref:Uncharacterized protein n=1 Tax=Paramecium primaurelia TaxID=5886 RepID=A0A8S1Q0W8_PARPR|nr:unnamed protein product [Paramecium primaurelia]
MSFSMQEANIVVGQLASAYYSVINKGYYLLKRGCAAITTEYRFNIMTNKIFRIKLSEIRIRWLLKQVSKFYLWIVIQDINQIKLWGIKECHLSDKKQGW